MYWSMVLGQYSNAPRTMRRLFWERCVGAYDRLLLRLPMEDGSVTASWVSTSEVHAVGAARGGALAQIAMALQRQQHEVMVEVVLPQELLCVKGVCSESHIAWKTVAIDFHVATIGTLQGHTPLTTVDDAKQRLFALVALMGVM